ncbi:DUF4433 domain-containing protein [uncultured Thalassospira sp.]|jgi:hypothetical protein|uniref:type II toxin-antitoxin system toxin DNA ADP-ribosyl transferase DarT n=1 Tax=uncultured Thalassospira sp. TaxID=404382 RepID=UPI0030DD0931|tara:strand:- start:1177 stop:1818 length:642 start_codon:yes stop_codon:yes gene_type:complete
MAVPARPKIYHIVHVDRLLSIVADGYLLSDGDIVQRQGLGTTIGMGKIKERRLNELRLSSHSDLYVGQCVPFYFCPRSIMLYLLHMANHPELKYQGGQEPIIHLEADLFEVVHWANEQNRRWAFTLSNAGSYFFEDRCDLNNLGELDWNAIGTNTWSQCKDSKQAEFLIERCFPWHLVRRIGVRNTLVVDRVVEALDGARHRPDVLTLPQWYY